MCFRRWSFISLLNNQMKVKKRKISPNYPFLKFVTNLEERFNMLSITELCSRSTSDWPLPGGAGGHRRCADLSALLLRSITRFTCRLARHRSKVRTLPAPSFSFPIALLIADLTPVLRSVFPSPMGILSHCIQHASMRLGKQKKWLA
jgi:hypothetical protein